MAVCNLEIERTVIVVSAHRGCPDCTRKLYDHINKWLQGEHLAVEIQIDLVGMATVAVEHTERDPKEIGH